MNSITITKEAAAKAFNQADDAVKKVLTALLGEEAVKPQKITDRIKTYEDACGFLGINSDSQVSVSVNNVLGDYSKPLTAFYKLQIIADALNEGWKPNWKNSKEYKYYPWFDFSGSSLSFGDCDYLFSASGVGSRLCFKSRELAEYAGRQFLDIYKDFMTF